ncbi:MAG: [dimethylamine--corrinoid protein] Co-methyltransferase, partial [candidate division Zixibacteria bacterium]|nr:[dimethylamine--corrinoid protein] Co-methyltransferase [candidate division Zixibacteria bacterium]
AGLYPHEQVKLAEKAGATIFGPAINTSTNESFPWNLARTTTFVKACVENAAIPIHIDLGMGVGAAPVVVNCPNDATSRAAKALVEICRLDG